MDYSKMSDFEINCDIARLMGYTAKGFIHDLHSGVWNPCNNPADAWPIIVDNSIGIKKQSNGLWVSSRHGGMYPQYHENPLRAAMIVFLMMQDSANVPANSTGSDIR